MANRYANLPGAAKIKDTYDRINQGFDLVEQDVDQLRADLDQEIADREAAVEYVDQRVDNIIVGGGPDKDPELVDIRTPASDYTPLSTIANAGDMVRDIQRQFMQNAFIKRGNMTGVVDFNTLTAPGSYRLFEGPFTNGPSSPDIRYSVLYVIQSPTTTYYLTQLLIKTGNYPQIWVRTMTATQGWYQWVRINNGSRIEITSAADLKTLPSGQYYSPMTRLDSVPDEIANDVSWYNIDISVAPNGMKQFILQRNYDAAAPWIGNLHTNGSLTWTRLASEDYVSDLIIRGTGAPEGVVTAPQGSLYLRTDGSTSTTLYVKTSGTGNTGWTAK